MEHIAEDLLYPELSIHSVLDDEGLCAHEGTWEGMEIGGILPGHKRALSASIDVYISTQSSGPQWPRLVFQRGLLTRSLFARNFAHCHSSSLGYSLRSSNHSAFCLNCFCCDRPQSRQWSIHITLSPWVPIAPFTSSIGYGGLWTLQITVWIP